MACSKLCWVYAGDDSGSVGGDEYYFGKARELLKEFIRTVPEGDEVHYLLWNTNCREVSLSELENAYRNKSGKDWTCPQNVSAWIKNYLAGKQVNLWLITDGEIDNEDITACVEINSKIVFGNVDFIVINEWKTNLSVGIPFVASCTGNAKIRGSDNVVHSFANMEKIEETMAKMSGMTPSEFTDSFDDIAKTLQLAGMVDAKKALDICDSLSELRVSLLDKIDKLASDGSDDPNLFSGSRTAQDVHDSFLRTRYYQSLGSDTKKRIDGMISCLINSIHEAQKLKNFVELKIEHAQSKADDCDDEKDIVGDYLPDIAGITFSDPVTLDESNQPMLLLNPTDLITEVWERYTRSRYDTAIACPLWLLIIEGMKNMISHVLSVDVTNMLPRNAEGQFRDPESRAWVYGGVVPFSEADDYNDYVLSQTFFRGKVLPRAAPLMYFVIAKYASQCPWVPKTVVDALKSYAMERAKKMRCLISFSNMPLDPKIQVPLGVAAAYVTEVSSRLFAQHPQFFGREKLRLFAPVSEHLVEVALGCGVSVDADYVAERARVLMLHNAIKKVGQRHQKVEILLGNVFRRTGPFLTTVLLEDPRLQYLSLLEMPDVIPFTLPGVTLAQVLNEVYLSYNVVKWVEFDLSPSTFRPYRIVGDGTFYDPYRRNLIELDSTDLHASEVFVIDHSRCMSLCKQWIRYVNENKAYPDLKQFTDYVAQKKKVYNDLVRLFPPNILELIERVQDKYTKIVVGVSVPRFTSVTKQSVPVKMRIEMENKK